MRRATIVVGVAFVVFASATVGSVAAGVATVDEVECSYPITVTDATGAEVTVPDEPERVVVLGPSAAQTMWEIGAREKVVGMPVNRYTSDLNGSEDRAHVVGQYGRPVVEKVIAQEPDLVLAPNIIQNETVDNLRSKGLTVYRFEAATSIDDVYAKTELTGRLVGNVEQAGRVSAEMQGQVAAIHETVGDEPAPRVFYNLGGGWTAGPDTFVGDVVTTAGGDNVAAGHLNRSYAKLSPEIVLEEDPEWILTTTGTPLPKNEGINRSTAVERDQIVTVNANYLSQPGPRNVRPLRTLATALHPEAMASVDLDAVETPTPATCATPTPTPDATPTPTAGPDGGDTTTATVTGATATAEPADAVDPTTTSGGGPGLGPGTAVAAFVVLIVVGTRRRRGR